MNKETVNDVEELHIIFNKALKTLKSLLIVVRKHLPAPEKTEGANFLGLQVSRYKYIFEEKLTNKILLKTRQTRSLSYKVLFFAHHITLSLFSCKCDTKQYLNV